MYPNYSRLALLIATAFMSMLCLNAQNTGWTSTGPEGGNITCLNIAPSAPNIIFAGTRSGIYKSTDGGVSWSRTGFPPFYETRSIMVHNTDPERIAAGTFRSGVFTTDNGGDSWHYRGYWNQTINSIDRDPRDPEVYYFTTGEAMTGTEGEYTAIVRVDDGWNRGIRMIEWDSNTEAGWSQANRVVVDPDSSNTLYAAGIQTLYDPGYGGVMISTDTGNNWTLREIDLMNGGDVSNLALVKTTGGDKYLFAIIGGSLLSSGTSLVRSPDLGETWTEVDIPYDVNIRPGCLMNMPDDRGTLILCTSDPERPVLMYTQESEAWDYLMGSGLPGSVSPPCMEVSAGAETRWYFPTLYGGLYISNGYEGRWDQRNAGFDNSQVKDFIARPDEPDGVYAAISEYHRLMKSEDAGSTWTVQPSNLSASFDVLSVDPNDPSIFWAGKSSVTSYQLFRATGYGQSWGPPIDFMNSTPYPNRTEITDIAVRPGDSETVVLSTQPWILNGSLNGFGVVARSTNGGDSWSNFQMYGSCLAMDPADPDMTYVGKERSGQVYLMEVDGASVTMSNIEPEDGIEDVRDLEMDMQGNLFVATTDGFWRRNSSGWEMLDCLSDRITTIAMDHRVTPSAIYAGSESRGVLASFDSGDSWMPFNSGLPEIEIQSLLISGNRIYASVPYRGIWSRPLPTSLDAPFLNHSTTNLQLSVYGDGALGHSAPNVVYGDGLVYRGQADPLYNGGFIVGSTETGMANGHMGSYYIFNDLRNSVPIRALSPAPGEWDQVTYAVFDDGSAPDPLGVRVRQQSFSESGEDYVLVNYAMSSQDGSISGVYAGIFADWDVGGGGYYGENLCGFDQQRNMAYQYLDGGDPDPSYYGIVALDGLSGMLFRPSGYLTFVREATFEALSAIENELPEGPDDMKMWIGSGPYDLNSEQEVSVGFAIVAGSSLAELQDNADIALGKYADIELYTKLEDPELHGFSLGQNVPNPFTGETMVSYSLPVTCDVSVDIYDAQGRKVRSLEWKGQSAGDHQFRISSDGLNQGMHFYRLRADGYHAIRNMLIR